MPDLAWRFLSSLTALMPNVFLLFTEIARLGAQWPRGDWNNDGPSLLVSPSPIHAVVAAGGSTRQTNMPFNSYQPYIQDIGVCSAPLQTGCVVPTCAYTMGRENLVNHR